MKNASRLFVLASLVILSLSTVESVFGFGIDAIYSSGEYYAALRGSSTSKIVKGTF